MNISDASFLTAIQNSEKTRPAIQSRTNVNANQTSISFGDVFRKAQDAKESSDDAGIKFSKHAQTRLSDRNISLSSNQLSRLNEGTIKAGEKGITDSLVLVDEMAFIVNVPNKMVVTAMDQNETSDRIFTNIDGAVIA